MGIEDILLRLFDQTSSILCAGAPVRRAYFLRPLLGLLPWELKAGCRSSRVTEHRGAFWAPTLTVWKVDPQWRFFYLVWASFRLCPQVWECRASGLLCSTQALLLDIPTATQLMQPSLKLYMTLSLTFLLYLAQYRPCCQQQTEKSTN